MTELSPNLCTKLLNIYQQHAVNNNAMRATKPWCEQSASEIHHDVFCSFSSIANQIVESCTQESEFVLFVEENRYHCLFKQSVFGISPKALLDLHFPCMEIVPLPNFKDPRSGALAALYFDATDSREWANIENPNLILEHLTFIESI